MTTEYAGAIDVDPPLTTAEIGYVRRLGKDLGASMAWTAIRNGSSLKPRGGADVATAVEAVRYLLSTMDRTSRFHGVVAAFDTDTRELVAVTVAGGRVTRKVLRKAGDGESSRRSNVIDLASRRRTTSRAIS